MRWDYQFLLDRSETSLELIKFTTHVRSEIVVGYTTVRNPYIMHGKGTVACSNRIDLELVL